MIDDYLGFLEYFSMAPEVTLNPYEDPLIRIDYDEINKAGMTVIASLAPYAHAIHALCYREIEEPSIYNQRVIANVCKVSTAEVSAWKNEDRIPEKYRWFLLLVDISQKAEKSYAKKVIRPFDRSGVEAICDVHLRMVKACYEPFCSDDNILMECVWEGCGIEAAQSRLLVNNPDYWKKVFKIT